MSFAISADSMSAADSALDSRHWRPRYEFYSYPIYIVFTLFQGSAVYSSPLQNWSSLLYAPEFIRLGLYQLSLIVARMYEIASIAISRWLWD